MPNPSQHHSFMLSHDAAQKANSQVSSISNYLRRFLDRLDELNVGKSDPLFEKADAAHKAMIELGIAVAMASKPPGKTRFE